MKRFILYRKRDPSGVSGTGHVAEGVEFRDGTVALRWLSGPDASTNVYPNIGAVRRTHGHGRNTKVLWLDIPKG